LCLRIAGLRPHPPALWILGDSEPASATLLESPISIF
jgi:hypothetical protein